MERMAQLQQYQQSLQQPVVPTQMSGANQMSALGKMIDSIYVVKTTDGTSSAVNKGNQENNALMRQEIALLQKQNELLLGILEKDTGISKNDIGIAAQSWSRDYSRRTGREAYSF